MKTAKYKIGQKLFLGTQFQVEVVDLFPASNGDIYYKVKEAGTWGAFRLLNNEVPEYALRTEM